MHLSSYYYSLFICVIFVVGQFILLDNGMIIAMNPATVGVINKVPVMTTTTMNNSKGKKSNPMKKKHLNLRNLDGSNMTPVHTKKTQIGFNQKANRNKHNNKHVIKMMQSDYNNKQKEDENSMLSIPKSFEKVKETASNFGQVFLKSIGQDKASIEKRKQKKEANQQIDGMLKGTGVFGAIVKPLMKSFSSTIIDGISAASNELSIVNEAIINALKDEEVVLNTIGSNIELGFPLQNSMNSFYYNGIQSKGVRLTMPVQGSKDSGILFLSLQNNQFFVVCTVFSHISWY